MEREIGRSQPGSQMSQESDTNILNVLREMQRSIWEMEQRRERDRDEILQGIDRRVQEAIRGMRLSESVSRAVPERSMGMEDGGRREPFIGPPGLVHNQVDLGRQTRG